LKKMIGDLMEVTRAEAGKLRVEVAPLQVDPFVRESVGTLHSAAAAKGISLPEGGSISVSAAREPVHGADWVRVSVTDTGCGISKGGQKKVFSRLHQENLESSETRKGLGLGLAICKELICLQGGGSRWRAGRAPEAPSTSRCRCFPWRGSWRRRS
jgi:signal transduction histidine kinase